MRDLNIDFMDLYKRTDRFIKDAYSSSEGVSGYIRAMESISIIGLRSVQGWKNDYDNLKHIRWIRNQLAHEVSYDSDICLPSDYEWLDNFYKRLFSSSDPLSILRKMNMKTNSERPAERKKEIVQAQDNYWQKPLPKLKYIRSNVPEQKSSPKQSSGGLLLAIMALVTLITIIILCCLFFLSL